MSEMKYTAKDSVFSFIFRQPENAPAFSKEKQGHFHFFSTLLQ